VGREGLTRMTEIEVVVRGTDVPAVRDLIERAGATGFPRLSGVRGLGHR
jgi:nitrogen regulatory protein PII